MTNELPPYYFRTRDNGAVVFKVDTENRMRRVDLEQIAVINLRSGEVRAQGDRSLTDADRSAIETWMRARQDTLAAREIDDIFRTIDHLNQVTTWAQSRATPKQLDAVTDALVMAMHDLRGVLVRKKADRLSKDDSG